MTSLRDKVVLITGASSGIGRATALRLAGMGARLGLAARSTQALNELANEIASRSGQALPLTTDVSDPEQCRRAVEETVDRFGRLDIVVCSAGLSLRANFGDTTLATLERVMRINFFGTLYVTHFALPHVKYAKGSLVAISSATGKRGVPSYALYGASKFAIHGLYEALHVELSRDGVHVGIVSPAFLDTPLRYNVLGGDGKPWLKPPEPPFLIWPVEKCVDRIVRLIQERRREIVFPWYVEPIFLIDRMLGCRLGNRLLARKFPPI